MAETGVGMKLEQERAVDGAAEGDDEEDDEDYSPEHDEKADDHDDDDFDGDVDITRPHRSSLLLSSMQEREVDAAFEALFGYKWGTTASFKDSESLSPQQRLLVSIFGPNDAARIIQSLQHEKSARLAPVVEGVKVKDSSSKLVAHKRSHSAKYVISSSRNLLIKPPPRTDAAANDTSKAPARSTVAGSGGIDKLLKDLKAPEKMSTIAKTSADWDQFKTESALAEKLEEKAESKEAYLNRQDFLNRVDHRKFEMERTERDRERAKRGK